MLAKPFTKGCKPGPGRPKGTLCITTRIKKALEDNDHKLANALARAIVQQAIDGNPAALKVVMDRIDGPVRELVDSIQRIVIVEGDDMPDESETAEPEDKEGG